METPSRQEKGFAGRVWPETLIVRGLANLRFAPLLGILWNGHHMFSREFE